MHGNEGVTFRFSPMHLVAVARRRPPQFIDRALDTVPNSTAFHVTGGHQLVGALGGM